MLFIARTRTDTVVKTDDIHSFYNLLKIYIHENFEPELEFTVIDNCKNCYIIDELMIEEKVINSGDSIGIGKLCNFILRYFNL